jgi:hypothetical protein
MNDEKNGSNKVSSNEKTKEESKTVVDSNSKKSKKSIDYKLGIIIIGAIIFLIFLIVFLVKMSSSNIDKYYFEYNGVNFVPNKNAGVGYNMQFYVNDAEYPVIMTVRNDPRNLEDIPIDGDKIGNMIEDKSNIYVTIDPEENLTGRTTLAAKTIDYFIDNPYLYGISVNSSFTKPYFVDSNASTEDSFNVKTCEDSSDDVMIIWLRLGSETAVFEEDGCIVVQGKSPDEMEIVRATDRLYLTVLGIMN